jgi:hypothetical protein
MALIVAIDLIVVGTLVAIALTKGFERALPFFAFVITLVPGESQIPLPGLFALTTQRVAIITLAALYLFLRNSSSGTTRNHATPLKYLILLTLGWNLISTVESIVFTTSLKIVLSNTFDFYLVYYIFTRTVSNVRTIHKILYAFVAALTVCCVFGWFEAYFSWRVIDLFPSAVYRFTAGQGGLLSDDRIRSTFPHAILFANGLALGIPWALYLLNFAKSGLQRAYLWLAIILMFWNTYKTMSRGPWLALVISLILLLLLSQAKIRNRVVVISLLTILVLVIRPGVWQTIKDTYSDTLDVESARGQSYQYRYTLMRAGREVLAKNLGRSAWGFGPESFYYLGLEGEDPSSGHIVKYESCDSAMVELMVDTGYVGLLLVMALLLKPTLVSLRGFTSLPKPANLLCLALFINLVAYIFLMVSVMNFGWGQQTYMLWIILALSMVYPRLAGTESLSKDDVASSSQEVGRQLAEAAPL